MFAITEIQYGLSDIGNQYLYFYLSKSCGYLEPHYLQYELLYDFQNSNYFQTDGASVINNKNEFMRYESPELNQTILDIIKMFKTKFGL